MKKIIFLVFIFVAGLSAYSQNGIPKISKKNVVINKNDNSLDITYDAIDPDDEDLEIQCKIFNLSVANKYEEVFPQMITGDFGFPVKQGVNKQLHIFFDLAANQSNLIIVLSALDRESLDINALISQVSPSNLQNHILQIQGKRNTSDPARYDAARSYITTEAEKYMSVKTLPFTTTQFNCINYEATKLGNLSPSNIIINDAHYDSVPISPGADDNGSGVAGVLEAIRILSDYAFKKSIRFLFFDLEELGLIGSTVYVSNQLDNKDTIKGVLNYEMIGYYSDVPNSQDFPNGFNVLFPEAYNTVLLNNNRGDFITNVACTNSGYLKVAFQTNANTYVPNLKVISLEAYQKGAITPDLRRSDHAVFWDKDIPAIMITDGANFRNHNYHTAKDSIGYLNFDFMSNVVKATIATMVDWAGIEHGSSTEIPIDLSTFTSNLNANSFYATYDQNNILIKSKINQRNTKIKLIDLNGNSVCNGKIDLQTESISKFHCQGFKSGIYFLIISSPKGNQTQKIFIHGF